MKAALEAIREKARKELSEIADTKALDALRVQYLGKKGELTAILKQMGSLSAEERPVIGQLANEVRAQIEQDLEDKLASLKTAMLNRRLEEEKLDVTIPGKRQAMGSQHPLSIVLDELKEIFLGMGFSVVKGPEVELDYYNFEALNLPKNHPARDTQDTFYINENILLRTQTSPVQIRTMEQQKPPIRIIAPGRVYRSDAVGATHSPLFHQIEGLVVDKGITMADLKGTLETFVKALYGEDSVVRFRPHHFPFTEPSAENQIEGLVVDKGITMADLKGTLETFVKALYGEDSVVRFRPHHFPFTEPSAEMDVMCFNCQGKGCRLCKGEGWIEILGCGMVHPKVLQNCGIDPEVYSGFAFGMGLERIVMRRYNIDDLRLFYENDLRFLNQF